jgi:hypothetical protein
MSLIVIKPLARDPYAGERLDPLALEPGDQVAWLHSGRVYGPDVKLARVVRLTATQIITQTTGHKVEYRFDRKTGQMRVQGGWGACLVHPNDPRVVRARVLSVARAACLDVETLARSATCKDIDTATGSLENIRTAVNAALDRMAKLLTATPSSLIEETES